MQRRSNPYLTSWPGFLAMLSRDCTYSSTRRSVHTRWPTTSMNCGKALIESIFSYSQMRVWPSGGRNVESQQSAICQLRTKSGTWSAYGGYERVGRATKHLVLISRLNPAADFLPSDWILERMVFRLGSQRFRGPCFRTFMGSTDRGSWNSTFAPISKRAEK